MHLACTFERWRAMSLVIRSGVRRHRRSIGGAKRSPRGIPVRDWTWHPSIRIQDPRHPGSTSKRDPDTPISCCDRSNWQHDEWVGMATDRPSTLLPWRRSPKFVHFAYEQIHPSISPCSMLYVGFGVGLMPLSMEIGKPIQLKYVYKADIFFQLMVHFTFILFILYYTVYPIFYIRVYYERPRKQKK
jgi:hypothetical protein